MTAQPSLQSLLDSVEALKRYQFKDAGERRQAMNAMRAASDGLQQPYDKMLEMWGSTSKDAAMKVCIDLDLFKKWKAAGKVQTAKQLSELGGADEDLMRPLLKHLATWHILHEEGPHTYSQTDFTEQLIRPEVAACVNTQFDFFNHIFDGLPTFLKANKYQRPLDPNWAPFSYAKRYHGDFFTWLGVDTQSGLDFDMTMKGYSDYRGSWLDVFPGELLVEGAKDDQALLVDVGGGIGHDLEKFEQAFPKESANRLILEDLPHVVAKSEASSGILRQPHNFLEEQPVIGARAYYMHQIMHDWPDAVCKQILSAIKPAMRAGSRILINEMVVTSTNATMNNTTYDLIMMSCCAGREREEEAWYKLIESVGLEIKKIWTSPMATEAVIEVVLKE